MFFSGRGPSFLLSCFIISLGGNFIPLLSFLIIGICCGTLPSTIWIIMMFYGWLPQCLLFRFLCKQVVQNVAICILFWPSVSSSSMLLSAIFVSPLSRARFPSFALFFLLFLLVLVLLLMFSLPYHLHPVVCSLSTFLISCAYVSSVFLWSSGIIRMY